MQYHRLHQDVIDNKSLFISPSLPFVCRNVPFVKPTVCQIYPFVKTNQNIVGFTLIELIITLTIAGILIAMAAPAMQTFIQNQRLTSQANALVADINIARSEAIKRGSSVTLCSSSSLTGCSASTQWESGRIVFLDSNGNGAVNTGDTIIRASQSLEGSNTLRSVGSTTTGITFESTGITTLGTGVEIAMRLCDSRGQNYGVTVYVNFTGRARIDSATVLSCT